MADNKGRREEPIVFFVYDHNMLKKEEDDLKDAILYFSPEDVSADDQCALCGQLMGMSEFLGSTLSKAVPQMYRFEQMKFALKRIGSYTLVLQGRTFVSDSLLRKQLDRLYTTFITFCGSIDSLRLRFKESHAGFLQELGNVCRTILTVAGVSCRNSLSQIFGAVPYIDLPKSGAHLFMQASHLLQSCQKRPYVMAGAILYKNGVLCTQLSPDLTRQLTFLQNQMPHISRTTEFDLPVGCRIITLFLTDEELQQIRPLDPQAKRHCKTADFRARRESDRTFSDVAPGRRPKNLTRRLTCPNIGSVPTGAKTGNSLSEKTLNNFLRSEQRKSLQLKQDAMGVDQMSWRRKPNVSLSHVPIVECQSGESPSGVESEVLELSANESHFAESYTELDVSQRKKEAGEDSETDECLEDPQSQKSTESSSEVKPLGKLEHAQFEHRTSSETSANMGDSVEREEETVEPSISELEDNIDNEMQKSEGEYDSAIHQSSNNSASHSNIYVKSPHINPSSKFKGDEITSESSVDEEEKVRPSFVSSDDRTVTLSKTSHHSVLHHKVDVHAQALESKSDVEVITDVEESQVAKPEHDTSEGLKNSEAADECSDIIESEGSHCDDESKAKSEHCSKNQETTKKSESSQMVQALTQSEEIYEALQDNNKASTSLKTTQRTKILDASDKENSYPNGDLLEDSTDHVDESEIETEEEVLDVRNYNPCINCLELASKRENNRKTVSTLYCRECFAKLSPERKNNNQEIIDFGEKSGNDGSEDHTEENSSDLRLEENENARDITERLITSSFSSDVSTDSTISRYWTQEMDGLNDVTLYVQCHSDISLLLVLDNPEKYQENLFHALWKGSLAQLADLDYYIKECLDTDDDDSKLNCTFARFDHVTSRLTGNVGENQEQGNNGGYLHQMLATLHSEFGLHHCLSDVNLRSQFSCCYGHHNQVDETYFQPESQLKLSSGLPLPRDPSFAMEHTVRSRLTKDRKISMI